MNQKTLPKGWKRLKVSQICDINPSIISHINSTNDVVDFVPMDAIDQASGTITYREKKLLEQVRQGKTRFQVGDVLFAKITPCTQNGKVALVEHIDGDIGYGSTEFYVLRARRGLLPSYLLYWLRTTATRKLAVEAMKGSSGRQRVPMFFWDEVRIPFPPLPVQRAIVTILDKASIIRGKQDNVSSLAEQVLLALFLEVFSDPTTNLKVWKTFPLGSLGEIVSGVTKGQRLHNRDTVEVPYLRVANVQDGYLDLSEVKTIKVPSSDIEKYQLQAGDLLLTEGGDPDKLGRGYIWNNEIEKCIHQNHIFRVRSDQEKVLPIYLAALMRTSYAKDYFLRAAKRSSNLASINMSQLRAFPVPLPPLDLQRSYIESVSTLSSARFSLRSSTDQIHSLFSSLLTRAFTGELIAEWEAANAERIATEVARLEQRPHLALLDLIVRSQQYYPEPIGVTSLMKYAFLAQMEGTILSQPVNHLYEFVPYHFGPFTQELYTDLEILEAKGWISVERTTNGFFDIAERVDISLNTEHKNEVESALVQLSDAERADLDAIIEKYGSLSHNELLDIVYSQYPAYASKSRLRKNHS